MPTTAADGQPDRGRLHTITPAAQLAKAYPSIRINAVEPGFTDTELNGHTGTQTVQEGAEIIVRMAQVGPDGPTGTFVSGHGPLPY